MIHLNLLVSLLVLCVRSASCEEDARDVLFRDGLVSLSDILVTDKGQVHIAMIIVASVKHKDQAKLTEKISRNLSNMLTSILKFSTGTPLHFIVITDKHSVSMITDIVKNTVGRHVTESVIRNQHILQTVHVPKLVFEFASLSSVTEKYRQDIDFMKKHYGYHLPEGTFYFKDNNSVVHVPNTKYTHDLFFIAPFYHREVPREIEKMIVIDIDLEFRCDHRDSIITFSCIVSFRTDFLNLFKHFSKFSRSELIGIGPDLSPHYYGMTKRYREKNPGTQIGSPGRFQGFNSGVTLYNLAKMRDSPEWEAEVDVKRMKEIAHQFLFAGSVGDQDWLTVLGWSRPEMFYLLPCHYNVQVHEGLKVAEHAERWEQYRNCSAPQHPDTKIIHYNGSW